MGEWSLSGKVILITGGARGIGAAGAKELARCGARPVLADLDAEALAGAAEAISPLPLTIEIDVTDANACEAAVERVLNEYGRIDVVWANAGIASGGPLQLTDAAAWRRTIEVNLVGAYHTVRAALPAVIEAFKRTYPVERAVKDIVEGLGQRRQRIYTPAFVYVAHALRSLMTTRFLRHDQLAVAPEMERAFREQMAARGVDAASVSERFAGRLTRAGERAQASRAP